MTYADTAQHAAESHFRWQSQARAALANIDWEAVQHRFLQDVLNAAMPQYWEARARVLEDARPRSTDFLGRATRAEVAAHDARLAADAARCRIQAALLRDDDLLSDHHATDVAMCLGENATADWGMAA
ncbi:MAG: hypothetical protein WBL05_05515 [Brooklawnia sp.]|uniref:hypothetical protein n=1 Tax=Brooklawnia sp. TaxID=2699740 RepID=UPI003C793AD1